MSWQDQIRDSITTIEGLHELCLTNSEVKKMKKIISRHPMRITPHYYSLINKQDKNDPIRKMAVPNINELERKGTYDSSDEAKSTVLEGVQHKYERTVLLLSNHRCAMYCRHCFRKRLVGLPNNEILKRVDDAVYYIQKHSGVNNILLTGGDPLFLSNNMIDKLLSKISPLEQLDFIRIGSRIPVTLPQRITEDEELVSILQKYNEKKKRLYLVTHVNHPREISPQTKKAFQKLLDIGIIVSNQGVLLAGVNDDPEILIRLHRSLIRCGVQPYYLFQCRPVRGIRTTFQVPLRKGIEIVDAARKGLDGISKRFRFIMSTHLGKMEILGKYDENIIVKMHQSRDERNYNKIIILKSNNWGTWYTDFK